MTVAPKGSPPVLVIGLTSVTFFSSAGLGAAGSCIITARAEQ
ncbi:hypothetical protein OG738_09490 [Amycolatopsis sp. NBC_01488]|nr:hypothetical protein [Amycolatopsis sp. NBC_01488]